MRVSSLLCRISNLHVFAQCKCLYGLASFQVCNCVMICVNKDFSRFLVGGRAGGPPYFVTFLDPKKHVSVGPKDC